MDKKPFLCELNKIENLAIPILNLIFAIFYNKILNSFFDFPYNDTGLLNEFSDNFLNDSL